MDNNIFRVNVVAHNKFVGHKENTFLIHFSYATLHALGEPFCVHFVDKKRGGFVGPCGQVFMACGEIHTDSQ